MKINREIIGKANIILLTIVFIDEVLIVGANHNLGTTYFLYLNLKDNLETWLISGSMFNIFFVLPLSIWIEQKGDKKMISYEDEYKEALKANEQLRIENVKLRKCLDKLRMDLDEYIHEVKI